MVSQEYHFLRKLVFLLNYHISFHSQFNMQAYTNIHFVPDTSFH